MTSSGHPRSAVARSRSRAAGVDAALVALGLFVVYILCANYSGRQIPDNASVFISGWAVGQHGTLDVSIYPEPKPWTVLVDGGIYSDRAPGLIAWVAPFYFILGVSGYPTTFPAGVAASTAAAAAVGGLFLLFCRLTTRRRALVATAIVAFGTATWTVSADAVWPHGPGQLCLVAMMLALASRRWWLAGAAGSGALLVRPIAAVVSAAVGLHLSIAQRSWQPATRIGLVSALGLIVLLVYNRVIFNVWTVAPGSYRSFVAQAIGNGDGFDPTRPISLAENIAGALVSPTRGVLVLSPFLVMLLPGLPAAWRAAPDWVRASALGGCSYAVLQVWGNNFAGGAGFYSYRYTIESLTLLAPLLLLCWTIWTVRASWRRLMFAALATFSVVQHVAGALYITPRHEFPYRSWRHYLLVEALQSADLIQVCLVVFAGSVAVVVAVRGELYHRAHKPRDPQR